MRCNCTSKSSVRFQELGWNVKLLVATIETIETIETMMVTVSTIVNIINVVIPSSGFMDMNYVIDIKMVPGDLKKQRSQKVKIWSKGVQNGPSGSNLFCQSYFIGFEDLQCTLCMHEGDHRKNWVLQSFGIVVFSAV